ncbi:MAG: PDGLE domain-containing protein [Actinobacteria bacterium]|nr:PDGLE domain-containing protein [Actinomycetota bacterium]
MTAQTKRPWVFFAGFAIACLLIAGVVSYFAASSPDGLDATTLKGCEVVETHEGEELTGTCIAQNATDHHMAGSPLADYAVDGKDGTNGVAGIIGVVVTVAFAGGLFWLIARTKSVPRSHSAGN